MPSSPQDASPQSLLTTSISALSTGDNASIQKSIDTLLTLHRSQKQPGSTLDDISTSSLEFIGIPYHLGRAYLNISTFLNGRSDSFQRKENVLTSIGYFDKFLKSCEEISDLLDSPVVKEYHLLLELIDNVDSDGTSKGLSGGQIREMKINRYTRKKGVEARIEKFEALEERRRRLDLQEGEEMEGLDGEGLRRDLSVERLRLYAEESLEEIQSSQGELEMLNMAIKMEAMCNTNNDMSDVRMVHATTTTGRTQTGQTSSQQQQETNKQPLQLTQITQDPITGQLNFNKQQITNGILHSVGPISSTSGTQQIKRQQIADSVFRPSWNLPTMSLEELAERERSDAIARGAAQKEAEAKALTMPRRYEQLIRDGMEDDADLVEKSAELDRRWDEWKEENPRGSGNKMGERGDRNF